ncbi:hypothetical protein SAMN05660473_00718 [Arthrobacter sp. 49Tsu3.1M3]|uniref:hypothetical protein n=1 Tax=Arthrobacter sp. 49Tsu3.1M3 TaxID=1279029 RepID=UPI0009A6A706|nr:hypothetical protein [Arthrobacter sp. 49Tsu3.1M3]SKB44183.1 hypothetical protein SAMN05660473_00718 [Arthrobacter sp. 49Tsu3.1M3]
MTGKFDDWIPFFEYLASSAAALLGLTFVALQINRNHLVGNKLFAASARTSLMELSAPLLFALIVLMPSHQWEAAAILVAILGYCVIFWHFVSYVVHRRDANRFHNWQAALLSVLLLDFGFLPFVSNDWQAILVLWMTFSGLIEAGWMLFSAHSDEGPPALPSSAGRLGEG